MVMDTATLLGTMVTGTTGTVMADGGAATGMATVSVSYTHLTLPTNREV